MSELPRYLKPRRPRMGLTTELIEVVLDGIEARYGTRV